MAENILGIEQKLLTAVCSTKDIAPLISSESTDRIFVRYPEVWSFLKSYYHNHRVIPDSGLLTEKFPDFEPVSSHGTVEYYTGILRGEYLKRQIIDIALKMKDKAGVASPDFIIDNVMTEMLDLKDLASPSDEVDITDYKKAQKDYERTRELSEKMGGTPGIPTGIDFIDSAYPSGLVGGDLVLLLGWTGKGKSLLSTLMSVNSHHRGFKPLIVTLEMKTPKVRDRAYTMMAAGKFNNSELSMGNVTEDDFREWANTSLLNKQGFFVVSHNGQGEATPAWVQSKIDKFSPDLVVFDYAQLGADNANSLDMTSRMRNMSREFKRLAVANNIPVILISSATPEGSVAINSAPIVEQVAWSKQLAYDADLAIAVHKHNAELDGGYNVIEIVGRKNRNGPLFAGYLKADINLGIYEELFDWDASAS